MHSLDSAVPATGSMLPVSVRCAVPGLQCRRLDAGPPAVHGAHGIVHRRHSLGSRKERYRRVAAVLINAARAHMQLIAEARL